MLTVVSVPTADATTNKYATYTNCDLWEVGEEFSRKPYALAVQEGSPLRSELSNVYVSVFDVFSINCPLCTCVSMFDVLSVNYPTCMCLCSLASQLTIQRVRIYVRCLFKQLSILHVSKLDVFSINSPTCTCLCSMSSQSTIQRVRTYVQ